MTTTQPNLALVLGASGGIGGEIARQLRDAGWQVRALKRTLAHDEEQRDGFTWLRGDAMNRDDVLVWVSIAWFATLCGGAMWLFFLLCLTERSEKPWRFSVAALPAPCNGLWFGHGGVR